MLTEMGMEFGLMHPRVSGLMRSTSLSSFVTFGTANKLKRVSLEGMLNIAIHSVLLIAFITPLLHVILSSSSSWLNSTIGDVSTVCGFSSDVCDNCKHNNSRLNV